MPPYALLPAEDADFPELIAVEHLSFTTPEQHFFYLFGVLPADESDSAAQAASVKELTGRQLEWHKSDPTSVWHKVVDTATGEIVGGALWKINEVDPYAAGEEHLEAYWYPEGGQRRFVTDALGRFEAPRAEMARRPHVCEHLASAPALLCSPPG